MPSSRSPLKIGTRGSLLALAQAHETRDRLAQAHDLPQDAFQIVEIRTSGDRIIDRPLKEVGGKGLFTKEIEDAMLSKEIDLAVHSTKDMPTEQPKGLVLGCFLEREDPRDAFVSHRYASLSDLPKGAKLGTSSLRRRAQVLARYPHLEVVEFRGNVQTRMRKLQDGVADATFLAMAGLRRLGMADVAQGPVSVDDMVPAVAQGAIGIEWRLDDTRTHDLLAPLHHPDTGHRIAAERAFLAALDGSCETPIGGYAELDGTQLMLRGELIRPDGSDTVSDRIAGPVADAAALGTELGERMKAAAGPDFLKV